MQAKTKSAIRQNTKSDLNDTNRKKRFILTSEHERNLKRKHGFSNKNVTIIKSQRDVDIRSGKEMVFNMQKYFESQRIKCKILYYKLWHLMQAELWKGSKEIPVPSGWLEIVMEHLRVTTKMAENVVEAETRKKCGSGVKYEGGTTKGKNMQTLDRKRRGPRIFNVDKRPVRLLK